MKTTFLKICAFALLLIFSLNNCKKSENEITKITDGIYIGTFQRTPVWGDGQISNISITFSSGKWSGQSDNSRYPALCHGTYEVQNNKLIFQNECAWTAEFDWSLILSGEYQFNINGNSLIFTQDYRNSTNDTYYDKYNLSLTK
jgi:hypothetical protein